MRYRAGAILVKFLDVNHQPIMQRMVKMRHFRNRDKNKFTDHGGHSILFDLDTGIVVTTTCHPTDKFCRREGTRVCVSRWVHIMRDDEFIREKVKGHPMVSSIKTEMDVMTVILDSYENWNKTYNDAKNACTR